MAKIEYGKDEAGILHTAEMVSDNVSKAYFYSYVKNNGYEKVGPGLYASEDDLVDPLYLIHMRCPQAVISHDEALHYHNLIDHEPASPTFTIYSGYNASRLKKYGYKPFFVKKEFLNLGKETVKDCFGNSVPMYDLERTICDLFRNRSSFEIQDFTTAVKSYARRKDRNIPKLYEYAGLMGLSRVVRQYLEVLL